MSGTIMARNGVWRPAMAPSSSFGMPVTSPRVMIGTPMAPKATGAVLATSATVAALSGSNPRASSITEVMATGVPKPASASISPPKQKAMMIAWMRWSFETVWKERRRTAKCPVWTVRL